jgi:hypothetical protein
VYVASENRGLSLNLSQLIRILHFFLLHLHYIYGNLNLNFGYSTYLFKKNDISVTSQFDRK